LAVRNDVLIVPDNHDDLRLLKSICQDLNKRANVGLRVSGFLFEDALPSRFGICLQEAKELLIWHFTPEGDFNQLDFEGFHFHINGYSIHQRATALVQTIQLIDELSLS
jgi:diaminopimelate decarboxylase